MPYQAGELPEVLKVRCSTNAMDGDGIFFWRAKLWGVKRMFGVILQSNGWYGAAMDMNYT